MARARVLCVDDHQAGLKTLAKVLELSGFEVVATTSPAALPALTDSIKFDAIVLDFQLPETNGVLLAQNLKQHGPDIPIVLITAYPADVPEHAANFIDAFLCKGHRTAKELPAVIVDLLDGKKKMSREDTLATLKHAAEEALEVNQKFAARVDPIE